MGGDPNETSSSATTNTDQPPWIGTDAVMRYFDNQSPAFKRKQLSGEDLQRMVDAIKRLDTTAGQLPQNTPFSF